MCADVDYIPHIIMKDTILTTPYHRRNSWATSLSTTSSSSSSSSSTATTTSWLERKLFSHFKRLFRRKSLAIISNSSLSSRRPSSTVGEIISSPVDEQPQEEEEEEEEEKIILNNDNLSSSSPISKPIDLLYDYDRLLARCIERQEHDRPEMILRCQTPISIPHGDLIVGQSRTILVNWKAYIRLFRALTRDPHLFQQYINEHYTCQSTINQREQLTFNIRTTKTTFDNVLRKFLDEYVTCLLCQTAQTHLIKSDGIWRIECQLCGSQRTVKRLRWKHHQ
jgi:translation initiation factor 2 beta subunit (eIF-2beta)/eIF-5